MARLDNPRHEHFAALLAEGWTATDAYAEVGYTPDGRNAGRLTKNDEIRSRVAELLERAQTRHDVTLDSLTAELEEAREIAKQQKNAAGMTAAIMGKAKLHGLETGPRANEREPLRDLSDDELDRAIERLAAEAGIAQGAHRKGSQTTH